MPQKKPQGRFSAIGHELRRNPRAARQRMVDAVVASQGMVNRAAHVLGVSRYAFWCWCYDLNLWPVVNEERAKRVERGNVQRRRLKTLEGKVLRKSASVVEGLEELMRKRPKPKAKRVRVRGGKRA